MRSLVIRRIGTEIEYVFAVCRIMDSNRPAADLAVLDIALGPGGKVENDGYLLGTVRTCKEMLGLDKGHITSVEFPACETPMIF